MKKFLAILLLSIAVLALATSCKSTNCPAYSKANIENNTDINS